MGLFIYFIILALRTQDVKMKIWKKRKKNENDFSQYCLPLPLVFVSLYLGEI